MTIIEQQKVLDLHMQAFGEEEGPMISILVEEMLSEPGTISINIEEEDRIVGNIIFTPFKLDDYPAKKCYLLAPVGVLPEMHGKGIGKRLIEKGVEHLKSIGTDAIFVLGFPTYYGPRGFGPTYVILPFQTEVQRIDAWRMMELKPGVMAQVGGTSTASEAIMRPMFWDLSHRPNK